MREKLCEVSSNGRNNPDHHVGLAYDVWAPTGADGKIPDELRIENQRREVKKEWLDRIANISISQDYQHAFDRWEESFGPKDRISEFTLKSRLLVGHGNPSPTEVGISVHHSWGVPIIPGSALKGLCAHHVETCYGPDAISATPWNDTDRGGFQGVSWDKSRIKAGPGEYYRALFGAPDAELDPDYVRADYSAGASQGLVTFHDALYVPARVPSDKPFAVDVLTVHQRGFYGQDEASSGAGATWANDYDAPNPIGFVSVRPKAKFLLALSGPPDCVALAEYFLAEALADQGVGGKTAAGYGWGSVGKWESPATSESN